MVTIISVSDSVNYSERFNAVCLDSSFIRTCNKQLHIEGYTCTIKPHCSRETVVCICKQYHLNFNQ